MYPDYGLVWEKNTNELFLSVSRPLAMSDSQLIMLYICPMIHSQNPPEKKLAGTIPKSRENRKVQYRLIPTVKTFMKALHNTNVALSD